MPDATTENTGTAVPSLGLPGVPSSSGEVVGKPPFFLQACRDCV